MSLVANIKALADKSDTNIATIEKECGFGNGTIRRWDERSPSVDKIEKLAHYLNVSIDYLLNGKKIDGIKSKFDDDTQELITIYKDLDTRGRTVVKAAAYTQQDRMQNDRAKVRTREKGMSCNSPSDGIENSGIA